MITLNARSSDFEIIAREFGATEKEIQAALKRAVSRTTRWASKEAPRRVAKVVKVTAKIIKGRTRFSILMDRDGYGRVWVGLKPIKLGKLNPRQTRSGVTAGPAKIPGAFIATMKNGHVGVFRRRGKTRLKIDEQDYPIDEEGRDAVESLGDELGARTLKEFERELRWQTRKR